MLTIQEIEEACQRSEPIEKRDAVHARMEFPLAGRFYPLGFPVDVVTNSEEVLSAAAQSWWNFKSLFNTPPIRIQVGVLEGNSSECPPAPACRIQHHLFSFVADRENFGINDLSQGFSSIWLTSAAMRHRDYVRYFFLECAAICQIATRCATGVHAACVARDGVGILLCGDSGAGKSTLSYACAKAGWTYVTDDGSFLVHGRDDLLVTGNCHQLRFRPSASPIFPEIKNQPVTQRAEVTKPSIELSPSHLRGIRHSQVANIEHVVFLNRRAQNNCGLSPYSNEVARHFMTQGRFSPPDRMVAHQAMIDKLLRKDALELRYVDLDWAVNQLDSLVDTEHP